MLNILICHTPDRQEFLERLNAILDPQVRKFKNQVRVLIDDSRYKKIGAKRNHLLSRADAKYICFIDDDDRVSNNYIELLMLGMCKNVDCCSLKGIITEDGHNPLVFEHSLKYKEWRTNENSKDGEVRYERYANHLNCIRTSIAKQFSFPETNHGEDHAWAKKIFESQLIKTEHYIDQIIYFYDWRRK